MLRDFEFIGVLGLITILIPVISLVIAWFLRPKRPNPVKLQTYESGIETMGDAWVRFKVQYYIYALIFVIFDVEAVFLLPVAVALEILPLYSLVWIIVFILLLFDGLLYAWRTGALHWS